MGNQSKETAKDEKASVAAKPDAPMKHAHSNEPEPALPVHEEVKRTAHTAFKKSLPAMSVPVATRPARRVQEDNTPEPLPQQSQQESKSVYAAALVHKQQSSTEATTPKPDTSEPKPSSGSATPS